MKNPKKSPTNYNCICCDYISSNKKDYNKHILTRKHQMLTKTNEMSPNNFYDCLCGKKYKHSSSLCKHRKTCSYIHENIMDMNENQMLEYNGNVSNEMFMEFIKHSKETQVFIMEQQREMHNTIIELAKNKSIINTTNNNTTTNNTQFNLQFFLNETCKDAMNIADFVNSLQVQIADLEKTGKLGYVEGISSIFLKGLKELDVTMRPIHCTDLKRETVYVKDENSWEKEDDEKAKLKLAIQRIARKNLRTLPRWQEENPDFRILDTKENDDYLKIALNSLGGQSDEQQEKYIEKILRNVLREVVIEKK